MGHPKRSRPKFSRPLKPWDEVRIERERKIIKEYGLRRKAEIWKTEAELTRIRELARELRAHRDEKKEKDFLARLERLGIIGKGTLDNVLNTKMEDLLNRRLQTLVFRKGLSTSIKHARQLITHGHIAVGERRLTWPSATVPKEMEDRITVR